MLFFVDKFVPFLKILSLQRYEKYLFNHLKSKFLLKREVKMDNDMEVIGLLWSVLFFTVSNNSMQR